MAISVTTDLTTVSLAESTADGGTWYRLNGTSSANPAADADAFVQGTNCVSNKMGATTGATDTGGHFNHATTFDLSGGKHLFYWREIITPGNMQVKASQGIVLGLTNTSTTSTTAWSTTNYKRWFLDGSDTQPISLGWVPYCLDASQTADLSAGTLTLTTVKNIGFICRQVSGITTTVSNQFIDAVRAGTGVTLTCSSGADAPTFSSIYAIDNTSTNRWGVLTQLSGIYYAQGVVTIGATNQANACNFSDVGQVIIWRKNIVAGTFYKFNLLSNSSTNNTVMQLTQCVIRGQSGQLWNVSCDTNSAFKAYGSSFSYLNSAILSSTSVLDGSSLSDCGQIVLNGGTITNSSFSNCTSGSQILCSSPSGVTSITGSDFTKGTVTSHAIEITGTAANTTLTNVTFSGYASANGSTGNEAVFVNIATGSMNLTISGGTTPSIKTAGCAVTVISGAVTVSAKAVSDSGVAISSAKVHLEADTGGPFPSDATVTIANSGSTATVTHTGHGLATNDKVVIRGASHLANNGVFTITVTGVNTYTYTMGSSPGTNPTGTIKASFVVLNGDTNVSGEISMSRVFPSNQPVKGQIRKSTSAPYYKQASLTGTVSSSSGAILTGVMISDD